MSIHEYLNKVRGLRRFGGGASGGRPKEGEFPPALGPHGRGKVSIFGIHKKGAFAKNKQFPTKLVAFPKTVDRRRYKKSARPTSMVTFAAGAAHVLINDGDATLRVQLPAALHLVL